MLTQDARQLPEYFSPSNFFYNAVYKKGILQQNCILSKFKGLIFFFPKNPEIWLKKVNIQKYYAFLHILQQFCYFVGLRKISVKIQMFSKKIFILVRTKSFWRYVTILDAF